jgi:hypothetical protein
MPGSSPTIDRREWVRRLKRLDLPTLGRPTMAIRGALKGSGLGVRREGRDGDVPGSWPGNSGPETSGSIRRSGPCRLTGSLREPGALAPDAVAPPVRAAAFLAAARLASARDRSRRSAGAERCAALATAARLPPFECGFGFLPLVPLGGFKRSSSLATAGSSLPVFHRTECSPRRDWRCAPYKLDAHPYAFVLRDLALVLYHQPRRFAAFAPRILLSRRNALALELAL